VSAQLLTECRKLVTEVTAQSIMLRRNVEEEIAIAFTKMILERETESLEALRAARDFLGNGRWFQDSGRKKEQVEGMIALALSKTA
jgi:hypothetical protein